MSEVLRSSWAQDGNRLLLEYEGGRYRIGTRWIGIVDLDNVQDACDAFEAIEILDLPLSRHLGRVIRKEIRRVPRTRFAHPNSHARIMYLVRCVEKRNQGLKVRYAGSKGSVEVWYR